MRECGAQGSGTNRRTALPTVTQARVCRSSGSRGSTRTVLSSVCRWAASGRSSFTSPSSTDTLSVKDVSTALTSTTPPLPMDESASRLWRQWGAETGAETQGCVHLGVGWGEGGTHQQGSGGGSPQPSAREGKQDIVEQTRVEWNTRTSWGTHCWRCRKTPQPCVG